LYFFSQLLIHRNLIIKETPRGTQIAMCMARIEGEVDMSAVLADTRRRSYLNQRWIEVGVWIAMGLGLALCYVGQTLPILNAGLLLLGALALLRPDLALLLVPLAAPLFLTSLVAPRSGRLIALPPHELALLVSAAAALPNLLAQRFRPLKSSPAGLHLDSIKLGQTAVRYAPEALLLAAGVAGLWMAVPEPQARTDALRAFRWFIAEPLIFITLIRLHARWPTPGSPTEPLAQARRLLIVFVIGGAAVALLGLLQFTGYLLHTYSAPIAYAAGGGLLGRIERVSSVYGNPNNMALYVGRVWPLAAALALVDQGRKTKDQRWRSLVFGLSSLACLAGIVISLSRGAWLGAGAALLVLVLPTAQAKFGGRRWPIALMAGAIVVMVGTLMVTLRGGPLGGSADVRILFWQESLKLLELRPLGVGLDQFFYYHNPAYGRSLIDPLLANTQERYARQPHNLLFEIWFNLGPLGLIAFGWLLVRCLHRTRAGLRFPTPMAGLLARGVLAALAAALVHGMVDSFYFWPDIAITFWLLVGVSELIEQHLKNRRTEEPSDKMTRCKVNE
jgi:O-antigen ligase